MEEKSLHDSLSPSEMDQLLIARARDTSFCRVPLWAFYLDLTRREQIVLGRIYSFQCTGDKHEFRMSLASLAKEMNLANRAEAQKILGSLVSRGFVVRKSNGQNKPASYFVNELFCLKAATKNGF